jgi:cytochrome oxidase Cu insertion factor (SCO1/SenC/PrrC family)
MEESDGFVLRYWTKVWSVDALYDTPYEEIKPNKDKEGNLVFNINLKEQSAYFSLGREREGRFQYLIYMYLLEPDDSIEIYLNKLGEREFTRMSKSTQDYYSPFYNFRDYSLSFEGNGASKYECRYKMDSISYLIKSTGLLNNGRFIEDNGFVKEMDAKMKVLNEFVPKLSLQAGELLKTDILGKYDLDRLRNFNRLINESLINKDGASKLKMDYAAKFLEPEYNLSMGYQWHSLFYGQALLERERYSLLDKKISSTEVLFDHIMKKYEGEQRERLLITLLLSDRLTFKELDTKFIELSEIVGEKENKVLLNYIAEKYIKGASAFPFILTNEKNQIIKMEDLVGKVVLIDFWFTGCAGCITFYQEILGEVENELQDMKEIVFVSISVDKNREKWLQSIKSNNYTSEHSINLYSNGDGNGEELIKHYNITSYPRVIIIDKKGKVFGMYRGILLNQETLKATLLSLI